MQIETLRIFRDLADLRNFSKTADKHLLSQSAISQQLAQLELEYNCQLIDRKKRPIELTSVGKVLYRASCDVIERLEQVNNELNALKSSTLNRINIAAIFSIGMHALPVYLKKFMINNPQVNVHVEYLDADEIYSKVIAGEIDFGIVATPKRDKRLEVYDFQREPLVLVTSPANPLVNKDDIDIHHLQFEKFIAFESGIPTRVWIDGIFDRYNLVIRPIMEFDNIETIKRAVEINSGVSILPQTAITQEISNKSLKAVRLSNENFYRPTGIITRKNKARSRACQYFIELLRKNNE
jgi:DNA-binding transcriptional LysR family regulator